MNILYIEDNPDSYIPVKNALTRRGHNVKVCDESDDAALEIQDLTNYDLIILDLMMILGDLYEENEAEETGIAIYERIRKINKDIKIVFLTAYSEADVKAFSQNDRNSVYHKKPFVSNDRKFFEKVEGKL